MANALGYYVENGPKEQPQRLISFEAFYKKYANRVNGFKYEWNNGKIEKTYAMKQEELYIVENLTDFFYTIKPKIGGILTTEVETWTSKTKWRRPDLAYFSKAQILEAITQKNFIPSFVIEVISKNDDINDIQDKILEYFAADVKVVWLVFPKQKLVHVYTSLLDVKICEGTMICSATSAVPYFELSVNDIFKV
jgi:Uma2 family endonuclease